MAAEDKGLVLDPEARAAYLAELSRLSPGGGCLGAFPGDDELVRHVQQMRERAAHDREMRD